MNLARDPALLAVQNTGERPLRLLGFQIPGVTKLRDPKTEKVLVDPAPTLVIEIYDVASELKLRATKALRVRYLRGEPYSAPQGVRSPRLVGLDELTEMGIELAELRPAATTT